MRRPPASATQTGVSLIELMITIALFVILAMMAFPIFTTWLASQQVRSATEAVLDGIHIAQGEAIKRNQAVRFVLDPAVGWQAQLVSDDSVLREGLFKEGSSRVSVTATPVGTDTVVFDGIGRIFKDDGVTPLDDRISFDVDTSTGIGGVRALRVVIDTAAATGVGIRSCDPALVSTDPRACPT
ncbi:MAG: GspH/FimT family pseudopilin [Betaproteobacteria bacterium]